MSETDVDAGAKREAIDIGEQRVEEVVAEFLAMLRVDDGAGKLPRVENVKSRSAEET